MTLYTNFEKRKVRINIILKKSILVLLKVQRLFGTYVHNWPLQPFSQNYGLASYTTHVVYVNFIDEWRCLQFNADSE